MKLVSLLTGRSADCPLSVRILSIDCPSTVRGHGSYQTNNNSFMSNGVVRRRFIFSGLSVACPRTVRNLSVWSYPKCELRGPFNLNVHNNSARAGWTTGRFYRPVFAILHVFCLFFFRGPSWDGASFSGEKRAGLGR